MVYELKAKNSETIQKLVGEETVTKEDGIYVHHLKAKVNHPDIWDVAHPDYYDLIVSLYKGTELIEQEVQNVGLRTIELNQKQAFLLNGIKV